MKLLIKSSCMAFGEAVKPGDIVTVPPDGGAGARYLLFNGMAELAMDGKIDTANGNGKSKGKGQPSSK